MELLEKQLELNNEIRAKEELQRECTQTRQQLTETETYVVQCSYSSLVVKEFYYHLLVFSRAIPCNETFCFSHLAISESKNDQLEKEVEILKQELLQARQAGNCSNALCDILRSITHLSSSSYRKPNEHDAP